MKQYLPHTPTDVKKMLSAIGMRNSSELFSDIPAGIYLEKGIDIPEGMSEFEMERRLKALSDRNSSDLVSFLGCGCYDHIIPSTVKHVLSRSEFYTSYTPYQAEISQGILQAIFEFQTLMCQLTDLDVSNASLYDGHTAASEAAVIALNSRRGTDTILYSETIHPSTKAVLNTYFEGTGIKLKQIPQENGSTSLQALKDMLDNRVAGVLLQTPNFYGCLEDYSEFPDILKTEKALLIISANPMSLGVLTSPGEWGADIAIGDTQPFGLTMSFGGPSVGYITAKEEFLRKMPGRIVGETVDQDGQRAFVLTLQAREQHIKRARATSNICSNQALAALANSVYLSTIGEDGFREVSQRNVENSHYLWETLKSETEVELLYDRPFFNEFTIVTEKEPKSIVDAMLKEGFLAGVPLSLYYPQDRRNALIIAVTEKRTKEEIDRFVSQFKRIQR